MNICLIGTDTIAFAGDVDFSSLKKFGELRLYPCLSADQVIENCADADVLLVNKTDLSARVIAALPRLKYIGLYSTGFNNVDWENCAAFSYYDYPMVEVSGKTLGIFGFGNIGRKVAKAAEALGMKILVCTRTKKADCPYEYAEKEALFSRSDFLSLHCPQNAETLGLIGEKSLALMKPTAILINTARGGLIDERALADALDGGRLAGAYLDVVSEEPIRSDNPLLKAKNCHMTPHIAWQPLETRLRLHERVTEHLEAYLAGRPYDVVND